MFDIYRRDIDNGFGYQEVIVRNSIIEKQSLHARNGYYTGEGNPELVGQQVKALRGMGFKKVKMSKDALLDAEIEYLQEEVERQELEAEMNG